MVFCWRGPGVGLFCSGWGENCDEGIGEALLGWAVLEGGYWFSGWGLGWGLERCFWREDADLVALVVEVYGGGGFFQDVELVWLKDFWVFDGVWFASTFFVVEGVVLEIYWIWSEVSDLDPFVCGVFAFWVWVDFCYLEHGVGVFLGF